MSLQSRCHRDNLRHPCCDRGGCRLQVADLRMVLLAYVASGKSGVRLRNGENRGLSRLRYPREADTDCNGQYVSGCDPTVGRQL